MKSGWGTEKNMPTWIVVCTQEQDKYAIGPFETSTGAENAAIVEYERQQDAGQYGYINKLVPIRNGEGK